MDTSTGLIAVVPDRVPGAEGADLIRPYFGIPLLRQSVLFAQACREVRRVLVASSVPETRWEAESASAVAFDCETSGFPDFDMLRTAVEASESMDGDRVRFVLLLNPLYPHRDPILLMECFQRLIIDGWAAGISSVTRGGDLGCDPVHEADRYLKRGAGAPAYCLAEAFTLWRRDFVDEATARDWLEVGRHQAYELDPLAARRIDPKNASSHESWAKEQKWRGFGTFESR